MEYWVKDYKYLGWISDGNVEKMGFEVLIGLIASDPTEICGKVGQKWDFRILLHVLFDIFIDDSEPLLVLQCDHRYGLSRLPLLIYQFTLLVVLKNFQSILLRNKMVVIWPNVHKIIIIEVETIWWLDGLLSTTIDQGIDDDIAILDFVDHAVSLYFAVEDVESPPWVIGVAVTPIVATVGFASMDDDELQVVFLLSALQFSNAKFSLLQLFLQLLNELFHWLHCWQFYRFLL